MQDFLDKLDDELNSMQPKKDAVNKEENKTVVESISNDENSTKSDLEKKIEEKIKKYDYSNKSSSSKKSSDGKAKSTNRFYNHDTKTSKFNHREKFISKFPETKFYLPSLREKHTRYIPIG
jgi:hypothetical protein